MEMNVLKKVADEIYAQTMKVLEQEKYQNLTTLKKSEVKEIFDEVSENMEE